LVKHFTNKADRGIVVFHETAILLESGIMERTRKLPTSVQGIPRIKKILKYNHILKLRLKVCTHITGAGIVQNKIPDTYIHKHTHTHTLPIFRPIYVKRSQRHTKKHGTNPNKTPRS